MFRLALLNTTSLVRNAPDQPGAAAPVVPAAAAPAAAPDAPVVPAPASDAPVAAPVVPAADAPKDPAAAPADAPKPADAPAKPDASAVPTLLEQAGEPAKPADAPKPSEANPAADAPKPGDSAKPADAPAAPADMATYEFKLPDAVLPTDPAVGAYRELLTEHKIAPEVGQVLLDRHVAEMTRFQDALQTQQQQAFIDTRKAWGDEAAADPEIGGAGHKTAMNKIAQVRDALVQPGERAAFDAFLRTTGAGDHPLFLKMLYRAAPWLLEPAVPGQAGNPPKTNGKAPGRGGLKQIYAENAAKRAQS